MLSKEQKQKRIKVKQLGENLGLFLASLFGSNVLSNLLQEIFDTTQTYLYCDATKEYLRDFEKHWNKKEKHWEAFIKISIPEVEEKYAADCSYLWNWEKKKLCKEVNEVSQLDSTKKRVFRWKKIMSIKSFKLNVDIADFLNKE